MFFRLHRLVAVLKTTPESVLEDYGRLMELAEIRNHLDPKPTTILKDNISWHFPFMPLTRRMTLANQGFIFELGDAGGDSHRGDGAPPHPPSANVGIQNTLGTAVRLRTPDDNQRRSGPNPSRRFFLSCHRIGTRRP